MTEAIGWIASAATMIAAMMTASNLGPRVTGWGFAVFLIGSVGWSTVGLLSGQTSLLWTNLFLCLVNAVGIWRWLGRRARYDDGGKAAAEASAEAPATPALFPLSALEGRPVMGRDGSVIAHAVDAMLRRDDGRISYVIVREGGLAGVGERLHALNWQELKFEDERLATGLSPAALQALEEIAPDHWPARPPAR